MINVYTDDDSVIMNLPESLVKKLRIGKTVIINGESYEVWYREESRNGINVRVEKKRPAA